MSMRKRQTLDREREQGDWQRVVDRQKGDADRSQRAGRAEDKEMNELI